VAAAETGGRFPAAAMDTDGARDGVSLGGVKGRGGLAGSAWASGRQGESGCGDCAGLGGIVQVCALGGGEQFCTNKAHDADNKWLACCGPLSLHWLTASGRGTWEFPEEANFRQVL